MKILMLGWEFPPFISGGLGTACYGLTKAMDQLNIEITFILPKMVDGRYASHVKMLSPGTSLSSTSFRYKEFKHVSFRGLNSPLQPYSTVSEYQRKIENLLRDKQQLNQSRVADPDMIRADYSGDMYTEVQRYANMAVELAMHEDFDVIHAHDWMTFPAAIAISAVTGKPMIAHIHSTEFDRSGEHVNQMIYDFERQGIHHADRVIAVSYFTRNIIISRYGAAGEKVEVVHNGVDRNGNGGWSLADSGIKREEKIVLFLGRITMQKGPEYFLMAAKKVLEVMDNVKFVMAGSGDMMQRAIEMAAELGIGRKVLFTGFLRGDAVKKIYQMADLFVMPSVSEPFGLVPLEALHNDVPVIISKQSGVSEVLMHALKVDFWDVNEIANKIVAVLKYPPLQMTLKSYGNYEVRKLRWEDSALKCLQIYNDLLSVKV